MTTKDKLKNMLQVSKGKLKERAGHAAGNDDLEDEGRADRVQGDVKQAAEKVKDALT